MPSRFSKRPASLLKRVANGAFWRRLRPARPLALAALAAAFVVAVVAGIQLGNSAIADINPVHYRGAIVHPRDRGAAVPEHQARPRQPTYAALYGWDEGRAAMAADREQEAFLPPPVAAPRRHDAAMQAWIEPDAPRDYRVTIHRGKDGVDQYSVQGRADRARDPEPVRARRSRDSYQGSDYRAGDVFLPRDDEAVEGEGEEEAEYRD